MSKSRADDEAVSRYQQVLRDAPPEDVEQINAEAFEQLTPEQRQQVFDALVDRATSAEERPADETPAELARAASEAERRHPGTLAGIVGGRDPFGVDRGLLNVFVGYAIGSELAFAYLAGSALAGPDGADGFPGFGGGFDGGFGGPDGIDGF